MAPHLIQSQQHHSLMPSFCQDTAKLLQLNKGQVVTAYSAFQRLTQRAGPPGQPVGDPPCVLPPIPADAQKALDLVGLREAGVPSLADIGYHDQPTSPFKVGTSLIKIYSEQPVLASNPSVVSSGSMDTWFQKDKPMNICLKHELLV